MSFLAALAVEPQTLLSKQGSFKPKKMCRSLPPETSGFSPHLGTQRTALLHYLLIDEQYLFPLEWGNRAAEGGVTAAVGD